MRTFIAIKIKPETALLQKVAQLKKEFSKEQIKWLDGQNLHLTLKFLGDTSVEQAAHVKNSLAGLAAMQQPVSCCLKGLGYFNNRGMPRVLFVAIQDEKTLRFLAEEIDARMASIGFQKETRPFNPHLTLARIKFLRNKTAFYEAVAKSQHMKFQLVTADQIIYYQSHLTPEGPLYKELAKVSLMGSQ